MRSETVWVGFADAFNLYVNDLIVELSSDHVGCSIDTVYVNSISYEDDMVVLCPWVGARRRLLSICEKCASEHGLLYNSKTVCYVMVFKDAGKVSESIPVIRLNDAHSNESADLNIKGIILPTI